MLLNLFFFQRGFPLKLWGEAVLIAVFLINRLLTRVLKGKSPFEMIYNYLPKFANLTVFGCLCFDVKLNLSNKFVERSKKCALIGYLNEKKKLQIIRS